MSEQLRRGERERLPNRRGSIVFDFQHDGRKYQGSISPRSDGAVGEIFINDAIKPDSQLGVIANDAAVAASHVLQLGGSLEDLRADLKRRPDGTAQGVLGAALDYVAQWGL